MHPSIGDLSMKTINTSDELVTLTSNVLLSKPLTSGTGYDLYVTLGKDSA